MVVYTEIALHSDTLQPLPGSYRRRLAPTRFEVLSLRDRRRRHVAFALRFTRPRHASRISRRLILLDDLAENIQLRHLEGFYAQNLRVYASPRNDVRTSPTEAGMVRRFLHQVGAATLGPPLGRSEVRCSLIRTGRLSSWLASLTIPKDGNGDVIDPARTSYLLRVRLGIEPDSCAA